MKALILAAGLGSRLRPLTDQKPKALVQYNGRELIDYQISALASQQIEEIIVVVGYEASRIKNFIKANYPTLKIRIIENKEFSSSNSAFSSINWPRLVLMIITPTAFIFPNQINYVSDITFSIFLDFH